MGDTAALLALLQRHYIKPSADLPGGVFVPEVGQNGGWGSGSRCDAIYIGFTNSSGRLLVGHELKVSRSDWLHELDQPGKADTWADECHEWWLVVPNTAIVADGELPAGWGLMTPNPRSKTRMIVNTKAARKDPATHRPGWDAVRSVFARVDTLRAQAIADGHRKARDEANRDVEERVARLVEMALAKRGPDATEVAKRLKIVEETLGGPIDFSDNNWTAPGHIDLEVLGQIATAARALGSVQRAAQQIVGRYSNPFVHTRQALDRLDEALIELDKAGNV